MTKLETKLVWGSTIAVTATGTALAGMKYLMTPAEPWAVVNHPLQPLMLKLHIATAPLLVFAIGMITLRHIWPHFRAGLRWARRSGVSTAALTVPMIVSGYAIQALSSASWLQVVGYVHFALGMVFAVGAVAHAYAVRRHKNACAAVRQAIYGSAGVAHVPSDLLEYVERIDARAEEEAARARKRITAEGRVRRAARTRGRGARP